MPRCQLVQDFFGVGGGDGCSRILTFRLPVGDPSGVAALIAKRRVLEALQHDGRQLASAPIVVVQTFGQRVGIRNLRTFFDRRCNGIGQKSDAFEREVHMIDETFRARRGAEDLFAFDQLGTPAGRDFADRIIHFAVGPHAQRVQVAGARVEMFGFPGVAGFLHGNCGQVVQFRMVRIEAQSLAESLLGLDGSSCIESRPAGLERYSPGCRRLLVEHASVRRAEGRAIAQVHRHCAKNRFDALLLRHTDNAFQVLPEVCMDAFDLGIGGRETVLGKHGHAVPWFSRRSRRLPRSDRAGQPGARPTHVPRSEPSPGCALLENRSGSVGTDHLVVAGVDHEDIDAFSGQLFGDIRDNRRTDGGHGGIDYFVTPRFARSVEDFVQGPRQTELDERITHGRRFAEYGHTLHPGWLVPIDDDRRRTARHKRLEKAVAVELVGSPDLPLADLIRDQKRSGVPPCECAASELKRAQQQQRRKDNQGEPPRPCFPIACGHDARSSALFRRGRHALDGFCGLRVAAGG